jgi:predicted metal-dependent peptidase
MDSHKVAAARLWAVTRLPYLASAIFASDVVSQPECSTIAVDTTWHVHADPSIVEAIDVEELGKLLVHLVGHLLRDHAGRAGMLRVKEDNARAQWNRATDAEINDDLEGDGFVPSSAPDLPRALECDSGGLAEVYFAESAPGLRHWDCGSGCDGSERQWDQPGGVGHQQAELLCLRVAADVQDHAAQNPGTVSGGWLRWAESIRPSRIDWRRVLAAEIRRGVASIAGNVDYTYRRPSRRAAVCADVILPSMHHPVPNVAVVCDTSGSMHEQLLGQALAEVEGLLARGGLRQTQVRVLAVDTNVHAVRRVSRASQVELAGGGGTDMGAGIEAAAALRPKPSVIVVLTDGFTPWPERPPQGVRVVIGLLSDQMSPMEGFDPPSWARTVRIEDAIAIRNA